MCEFALTEPYATLRRNVRKSSYKVPVVLVRSYYNLNFLDRFSKNTRISDFIKIRPAGAEPLHADGQKDITNLIS
jgi:hypothetical protein